MILENIGPICIDGPSKKLQCLIYCVVQICLGEKDISGNGNSAEQDVLSIQFFFSLFSLSNISKKIQSGRSFVPFDQD